MSSSGKEKKKATEIVKKGKIWKCGKNIFCIFILFSMHIEAIEPQDHRWNSTPLKDTGENCTREKTILTTHVQEMGPVLSVFMQKADLQIIWRVPWNCQKLRIVNEIQQSVLRHYMNPQEAVFLTLPEVLIPSSLLHYINSNLYDDTKNTEKSSMDATASKLENSI